MLIFYVKVSSALGQIRTSTASFMDTFYALRFIPVLYRHSLLIYSFVCWTWASHKKRCSTPWPHWIKTCEKNKQTHVQVSKNKCCEESGFLLLKFLSWNSTKRDNVIGIEIQILLCSSFILAHCFVCSFHMIAAILKQWETSNKEELQQALDQSLDRTPHITEKTEEYKKLKVKYKIKKIT